MSRHGVVRDGTRRRQQPNILVIWSDDIGQTNVSAYTRGLVGYRTPNIDRIARGGMIEHDKHVGKLLDKLDELGITENTIVLYTTDNGPHKYTWPDAGLSPFRNEKNSNWEGAFRVPCVIRWPGNIEAGSQLVGVRFENWKLVFLEQRVEGTLQVWAEPFTPLRLPKIFDLRADPYEQADVTSNTYYDWMLDHAFLLVPAQSYVGTFLETSQEYPPRQRPSSFNLDDVMTKLREGGTH